jgi:hypothetical protein
VILYSQFMVIIKVFKRRELSAPGLSLNCTYGSTLTTPVPVLSIPVVDCNRFALKPLKWLRFLGYAIYGREGRISETVDAFQCSTRKSKLTSHRHVLIFRLALDLCSLST